MLTPHLTDVYCHGNKKRQLWKVLFLITTVYWYECLWYAGAQTIQFSDLTWPLMLSATRDFFSLGRRKADVVQQTCWQKQHNCANVFFSERGTEGWTSENIEPYERCVCARTCKHLVSHYYEREKWTNTQTHWNTYNILSHTASSAELSLEAYYIPVACWLTLFVTLQKILASQRSRFC